MGIATKQVHGVSNEPELKLNELATYILRTLSNKKVVERIEHYAKKELTGDIIAPFLVGNRYQFTKPELAERARRDGFIDPVLSISDAEDKVYKSIQKIRKIFKDKDFPINIWSIPIKVPHASAEVKQIEIKEYKYFIFPNGDSNLLDEVIQYYEENNLRSKHERLERFLSKLNHRDKANYYSWQDNFTNSLEAWQKTRDKYLEIWEERLRLEGEEGEDTDEENEGEGED